MIAWLKRRKQKGLTIIELLVVITVAVLLILASILMVPTQIKKGKDARRKADLDRIKIALYDYYFDNDCFPEELPGCGEDFGADGEPYLNNFPCDPTGINYEYQIEEKECSQWFKILTNLENTRDPGIDKVGCRGGCGSPECNYNYGLASTNIRVNEGCPGRGEPPEGCFIATAVYGTPSALQVNILKEFRDEVLLQNNFGQELVEFYYQSSPPIAQFLSAHPLVKETVRKIGIDPIVRILEIYGKLPS